MIVSPASDPTNRPAMPIVPLLPVLLALVVLGAHFFRAGDIAALSLVVLLIALMPLRRRWVSWLLQAALALGTLEWLRTLAALIAVRESTGGPYLRLAVILGGIAAATAMCTLCLRSRRVRDHFAFRGDADAAGSTSPTKGAATSR